MSTDVSDLTDALNADKRDVRLHALAELSRLAGKDAITLPSRGKDVNNHIHTKYSFSPYSPCAAVWKACESGLCTAGIMDHDSVGGAREFREAGAIMNLPVTTGVEVRASFKNTPFSKNHLNNPDQAGIAYVTLHGIPHSKLDTFSNYFKHYFSVRNKRNLNMTEKLNDIISPFGLMIDFVKDICPVSFTDDGGQITERHILFALSVEIMRKHGKGKPVLDFLKCLRLSASSDIIAYLSDTENPFYEYDLTGFLKSSLLQRFYIDAAEECPPIEELSAFASANGIICSYAYLGDVHNCVTGDKRDQKFEDGYLNELFQTLKDIGFAAVSYMPSRNTVGQLKRVRNLCEQHSLMEISGEDINQPRQPFICKAMRNAEYSNLYDTTWALIGHEMLAAKDIAFGMFSAESVTKTPNLYERIDYYKNYALKNYE